MNLLSEDYKELRKALGGIELFFYFLRIWRPGPLTYWLLTDIIALPAAALSLSRLVSAGRKGRFAWAAALCLLLGVGMMVYHAWRFWNSMPPEGDTLAVDGWLVWNPVFLVGSLAAELLMENTDSEGRLQLNIWA